MLLRIAKKIARKILGIKPPAVPAPSEHPMKQALERLKKVGFAPDLIIDVGAAAGQWCKNAIAVYGTETNVVFFEPIPQQLARLKTNIANWGLSNYEIVPAVAGATSGQIKFNVSADLDGSGVYGFEDENTINCEVKSVDEVLAQKYKPKSCLLKLDTHGYEIPIFEGSKETLKNTEAIVVEVYGFYVAPDSKLFHEVSQYLLNRGYRLFDIIDILRRPKDGAFWQCDAIFLRSNHEVFANEGYH